MTLTCPTCHKPAHLISGAGAEAVRNGVHVVVPTRPRIACPDGHDTTRDVSRNVWAAVQRRLPVSRQHWRRGACCSACTHRLTMPARWTQLSVTLEDPCVFTVTLDLPAVRCPHCGVDHLPVVAVTDVAAAIDAVFVD